MKSAQSGLWAVIGVLLAGIFLVDVEMGLGFTPWLLYVIPLGLTYWASSRAASVWVAALCTVLIVAGFMLSPPLAPRHVALTNRIFGLSTFWILAALLVAYKQLVVRLSELTEQLSAELAERTRDLGLAMSALQSGGEGGMRRAPEGERTLEQTRGYLEQLGRQLEQLQRDLLRP